MFLQQNLGGSPFNLSLLLTDYPTVEFKKRKYIFLPGDESNYVYFIKSGKVKIGTYGPSGKEITKNILSENDYFGEKVLTQQRPIMNDFAYVTEDLVVHQIPIKEMKSLMHQNPEFMLHMLNSIGKRKQEMEQRLESLYFKDSRTRIIEFLYNLSNSNGERVGFETVIREGMTHQEIANLTATSRQTVTTVLNELRNRNVITFNRRRFLIRDMDILQKEGRIAS